MGPIKWKADLARTSGVFVVVGIGSYAAYRLYSRLVDVPSSSSDTSPEQIDTSTVGDDGDRSSIGEGFYAIRVGEDDEIHQTLHQLLKNHSNEKRKQRSSSVVAAKADCIPSRYRVVRNQEGSPLRLLYGNPINPGSSRAGRGGRLTTDAGIASVTDALPSSLRGGVVARECGSRRDHSNESQSSGLSGVSSASRQQRGTTYTPTVAFRVQPATPTCSPGTRRTETLADAIGARSGRRRLLSGVSSTHSASLLLVWDGEEDYYWLDEEWNVRVASSRDSSRGASPTPSGISDLSAVERLEQMFRQAELRDSMQPGTVSGNRREEDLESTMSRATSIHRLGGSLAGGLGVNERLYRSVVLDDGRSVASSSILSSAAITGGSPRRARVHRASRRDIGLCDLASPKHRPTTLKPHPPLWSPAQVETCTPSSPSAAAALMTDSAISKESAGSSLNSKNTGAGRPPTGPHNLPSSGAMFDSAIVTDLRSSSSEDEEEEEKDGEISEAGSLKSRRKKEGVVRRTWLGRISEKPSPQHRPSAGGTEGERMRRSTSFSSSVRSAQLEWD